MSEVAIQQAHADEHERLLQICRHMSEYVGSHDWPCLTDIDSSLATDRDLQAMTTRVRARFLEGIASITSRRWRTPPDGVPMPFPGSEHPYAYTYDRQHPPKALESRFSVDSTTGVVLCSSGMAALNTVFQAFNFLLDERLKLAAFASYFETLSLLRIGPFANRFSRAGTEAELAEVISSEDVGIVLLEPVHYDWRLWTTRWSDILTALSGRAYPPIVILDTTLTGICPEQSAIIQELRAVVPTVVNIRSGIKLDQQGLELANLGLVEYWCDDPSVFEKIGRTLRTCRSICGATLTWSAACALASQHIFGPESTIRYSQQVFDTARDLAERVRGAGDLFSAVSFPAPPWAAPIVVLELAEGGNDNYRDLATTLDQAQEVRGLTWQMSGSFGFRTHRFETILPDELLRQGETHAGALKIAAGCYAGARHEGIVELLQELSSFSDLETARKKLGGRHHSLGGAASSSTD